jgi:predicted short-subunit dehydrogenase-like oxidoreductase (DUF2520 family)
MLRAVIAPDNPTRPRRRSKRPSIAFVGAGALATSLARALSAHGYPIREFVLRTNVKPRAAIKTLARDLNAGLSSIESCALDAEIIWVAVPDDSTELVAQALASGRNLKHKIALHSSGALSSEVLAPLRRAGASTASLHPMMSFTALNRNPNLKGVWFSVEGEAAAVSVARKIAKDLGGNVLTLKADQKALYHAFGAMIAPLLVSHLEAAEQMAQRAGLDAKSARMVMKPIVEKVISTFLASGAQRAFSGPFLRGDINTVQRHLRSLQGSDEEEVYRALAAYAVEHIEGENKKMLRKILKSK